jgi:hypothetical protein
MGQTEAAQHLALLPLPVVVAEGPLKALEQRPGVMADLAAAVLGLEQQITPEVMEILRR